MLLPDSKQKEYEQNAHTPFVFRQVKPALWKAPLRKCFFLRKSNQTEQSRGKSKQKYTTFIGVEEANIATTRLNGLQLLFFQLLQ